MLFNSYEFLFAYLPIVMIGFFLIARINIRVAAFWLALSSLFFYGWWDIQFVPLLLGSITFNYVLGYKLAKLRLVSLRKAKWLLIFAITSNLTLLGYFKYTNFLIDTLNQTSGNELAFAEIILPLGISFFTFTQISFLVDVYRKIVHEYSFIHYLLFVTYFPHLIAGPVLHHQQMMPQFSDAKNYTLSISNLNMGLIIFSMGLFKKVVFADQFSLYADPIFDTTAHGYQPDVIEAWIGALAYTLQLYFDFSAYSDMAVGLSRIFNVRLPINFNSPYKSLNIIDFWRRWHITLSEFLKDYVYIPLGGNRKGTSRRYVNLLATMLIGGLWHGANWTFVLWGGLHGLYLVINHGWRALCRTFNFQQVKGGYAAAFVITFIAIVISWVFFRADTIATAMQMIKGMSGFHGISFAAYSIATQIPLRDSILWIIGGLMVVCMLPNSMQIANFFEAKASSSFLAGFFVGVIFLVTLMSFKKTSSFIYFQF